MLSGYYDIRRRNITMDRLYSPLSVANWSLNHGITMVGKIMPNKGDFPTKIKDVTNRGVFSTEIYCE